MVEGPDLLGRLEVLHDAWIARGSVDGMFDAKDQQRTKFEVAMDRVHHSGEVEEIVQRQRAKRQIKSPRIIYRELELIQTSSAAFDTRITLEQSR